MDQQQKWAEDDFDVPVGVTKLGHDEPVSGRKYIMYHGTSRQNVQAIRRSGFRQSADGMLGRGVYLSRDLQKASRYPISHRESDRAVLRVLVDVGRVIAIRNQGHPRQRTWHDSAHGDVYDTAWVPPNCGMVKSGLEEDCVWDPDRIKIISIINPTPVERPRPVQPSSSWSGTSYSSGWSLPCQHSCCLCGHQPQPQNRWMENSRMFPEYNPMMDLLRSADFRAQPVQWLEIDSVITDDSDEKSSSGKKTKTRATTSKKKK